MEEGQKQGGSAAGRGPWQAPPLWAPAKPPGGRHSPFERGGGNSGGKLQPREKGDNRMRVGKNLFSARKKSGLSQEEAAGRLGVSRQTISKWELDETLPDVSQFKGLAELYGLTMDELAGTQEPDPKVEELQEMIRKTSDETSEKVDWGRVWGQKYPILTRYRSEVETGGIEAELARLLDGLKLRYGYGELDAFLVLKDILAQLWKERKEGPKGG